MEGSNNNSKKNKKQIREVEEKKDDLDERDLTKSQEETTLQSNNENYFSEKKFTEFGLSDKTLESLKSLNFHTATEIQSKCIPLILEGNDIIGSAKTGSGKSLAFLIPAIEKFNKDEDILTESVKVLVLTPTRELALQLFTLTKDLLSNYNNTCALIMGGANRKVEAEKLKKGVSVIIATPGRLLDHMANTKGFIFSNINLLIIDEADAILKNGFEKELREILSMLPKQKQSLLFSATISPKVEDIIRLSMKSPIYMGIKSKEATVSSLQQGYVIVSPENKFLLLYTFVRKNLEKKIMIFYSSCKAVEFYSYLLNYVDIPVKAIHGGHKQQKRSTTYLEFLNSDKGILLCTDVAQRGLDFPDVDWIIQYDPPHDPEEYLHRVGRTARGATASGKALLILLPNEIGFIRHLKTNKININEFEFGENKLLKVQEQFEKLVNKKDHFLLTSAIEAYRAYLHSYIANTLKDVYDINKLDLAKVCKSFGLENPPMVHLNLNIKSTQRKKKGEKNYYSQGYESKKDARQFTY